ncbi:MAG: C69 family dipeptidase [Anaerolineae bacterium]|nr:C69 family dipeptidase [Anaerolineae bacterium]
MCDTVVALGNTTADGAVLFAKNSDREANEAQALVYVPRTLFPPDARVQCTHLEVPQVRETYAVLLSKPFWMWGCEMGVNERGVAIGNEAVFTKEPYEETGLLGMDMLRLALERAADAREALGVLIDLLETYGQHANGGYQRQLLYHNSFLIADTRQAWVLETAGRYWAALQVRDFYTISNGLTIGAEWDLASAGLVEHAIEKGWCASADDFHFAHCYSDAFYTRFSHCRERRRRSMALLAAEGGELTVHAMLRLLRDHGADASRDPRWSPIRGSGRNLCVHAGFGPLRNAQSTGSLVAHLDARLTTAWCTGASAPCLSTFKPVWLEVGLPDIGPEPGATYDPETLWWHHERLHREVLRDYPTRLSVFHAERDTLEKSLLARAATLVGRAREAPAEARAEALRAFSTEAFARDREATEQWITRVQATRQSFRRPSLYRWAWLRYNRKAALPKS